MEENFEELEILEAPLEPTEIVESPTRKVVPVPKEPFEKFMKRFRRFGDILKTKEWHEIYSNYYEFDEFEQEVGVHETKEEIESYDLERQADEIRKCARSFTYFCVKYIKINHPIFGLINFLPYRYQRRVVECYGKHRFNILSKFRQGGLTTVSVLWALWRCLFKNDQRIMVVSKTDREAIAAGEMVKLAMEHLPFWMQPVTDKCNEHEKQFKDTNSILWFYTVEAARGKSITILIIDEAAFIQDMQKHWKALYPVIATGGSCIVVSTVNGMGNWYEETYHEAEDNKNAFSIIELDYWEHPQYNDPKWIEDTRSNLGEKGWQQEVERSFLSSSETWLNGVIIKELENFTKDNYPLRMSFERWKNHSSDRRNPWDKGALWLWREPIEGHEYIIGVDVAEGVGDSGDNSCFEILDINTLEQVGEFYSNSITPYILAQLLNEVAYYYNTAQIVIENMHPGNSVLTTLQYELAYENLYYEDGKQQNPGMKPNKTKRGAFLETLQQRIINSTIKINSKRLAIELATFIYNPKTRKVEARPGKHDDAIIALSMALYVRDSQMRESSMVTSSAAQMLKVFKTQQYEEIKREVLKDTLHDWLAEIEENDKEEFRIDNFNVNANIRVKRKNESLMREFGW